MKDSIIRKLNAHVEPWAKDFAVRLLKITEECRPDMHEPDEQGLSARAWGDTFDNAGVPGELHLHIYTAESTNVTKVSDFNMATLVAFARIGAEVLLEEHPLTPQASTVRYPDIHVKLTGADGNAFNVLSLVRRALYEGGVPNHDVDHFLNEAMAGDYDHLLATCMKWVEVE